MSKYTRFLLVLASASLLSAQTFSTGQGARAVIGQFSFTGANSVAGQQIVGGVSGLAYANGTLFVADSNQVGALPQDNRVLMFDATQIPATEADVATFPTFDIFCHLCGFPAVNVLGQANYTATNPGIASQALQTPTGVATDGNILAVADMNNNRVLIWTSTPTTVNAPANIVLGQTDFVSNQTASSPTAQTLRGPSGVWIQGGKLFVADTQDNRVLIWNSIPHQNDQPADLVLGQPNFTSANGPPPTQSNPTAAANQLLSPVSVTSDGTRLYVADLGFNRVLIWNSIPTTMDQPANVVVGQPDMVSTAANNRAPLCPSIGATECNKTLNFPRYALSDGTRLFIADSGNDRVLVFDSIPTTNGTGADGVLGQPDFLHDVVTNQSSVLSTTISNAGSVDTVPSPMSLALEETDTAFNLYISDPYNRRVLVFTAADTPLPPLSVLNNASEIIRQEGTVTLIVTSVVAKDTVTVTIAGTAYTYTIVSGDTLTSITQGVVNAINAGAGDPNATALLGPVQGVVYLTSKGTNLAYDSISLAASTSNTADITATVSNAYLTAGTAATVAPGTIVEINGTNLSDNTISTPLSGAPLSSTLGVTVSVDGFPVPIWSVSPSQVIAQIPYAFSDTSASIFVRTVHNGGNVTVTTASAATIAPANPGLYGAPSYAGQPRPWPAVDAFHQANPAAVVSVDGTVHAGDVGTITINGRAYSYTVQSTDTLATIVNGLIAAINSKPDPQVFATPGGAFTRVVLVANQTGAAGTGIPVSASVSSGAQLTLTPYTNATCCAVTSNTPITAESPALPGEIISLAATGLGLLAGGAVDYQITGAPYTGPQPNSAVNDVSATMNGTTAEVIGAGLYNQSYGLYSVQLLVPTGLASSLSVQTSIAQNAFISNIVTVPVGTSVTQSVTFSANPRVITPAPGTDLGSTILTWSGAPGAVLVYVGNPAAGGTLLANAGPSGSATANGFVTNGMTFYLQDATNPNPLSATATLATVTVEVGPHVTDDFLGNGKADFVVWRPSTGTWYILPGSNLNAPVVQQWGLPGDIPIAGDFDGDGKNDFTVWRPSGENWYFLLSANPNPLVFQWGLPGDIPLTGDFDGVGKQEMTVWRPSTGTWYVVPGDNPTSPIVVGWGQSGDIPVPADFDGDGKTDFAVWRPSTGVWYILPSSTGVPYAVQWGVNGDIPIPADFDGDGKADVAIWRPSSGTWWVIPSSNPTAPVTQQWGLLGDIPLPLDFDGDNKADFAIWRPSTGTWWVIPSSNPTVPIIQQWGLPGDIPVYSNSTIYP